MKIVGSKLKVLVVDDEPLIVWGIASFLRESMAVKTVGSAEAAIEEIETKKYDLCLMDFNLPGITGLEAMKIINERSPSTKVAIMSGSLMDEVLMAQIQDHAFAYIEKPFDLKDISCVAERAAVAVN